MVYFCDTPAAVGGAALAAAFAQMPAARRARVEAMTCPRARRLSVLAFALLCHGLEAEYGIAVPPTLAAEPGGRPYFPDRPDLYISLSHCRAGAACALSCRPVGVDMQEVRPYRPALAARVCTAEELAALAQSAAPDEDFCALWSVKEAYCKRSGAGIGPGGGLRALSAAAAREAEGGFFAAYRGAGYHLACFGVEDSPCVFRRVAL